MPDNPGSRVRHHLPAAPLLERIPRPDPANPTLRRAVVRARQRGWVTWMTADRLAVELVGVHPAKIWGVEFWGSLLVRTKEKAAFDGGNVDGAGVGDADSVGISVSDVRVCR